MRFFLICYSKAIFSKFKSNSNPLECLGILNFQLKIRICLKIPILSIVIILRQMSYIEGLHNDRMYKLNYPFQVSGPRLSGSGPEIMTMK